MNYKKHLTVAAAAFLFAGTVAAQTAPAVTKALAASAPAAPLAALPAQQKPISVTLTQKKVIKDEQGREKLTDADSVPACARQVAFVASRPLAQPPVGQGLVFPSPPASHRSSRGRFE